LKKLLKLKNWLTVSEAARHLSILFGEDVTEADVLRFALDGHLELSVRFVNKAPARRGTESIVARAVITEIPSREANIVVETYTPRHRRPTTISVTTWEEDIDYIDGIWDLLMVGAGRTSVENRYQFLTDGPAVETIREGGLLVSRPDGTRSEVLEYRSKLESLDKSSIASSFDQSDHYYPAEALPSDAAFVVRTSALQDLEALMSESEPALERQFGRPEPDLDRPVGPRERTTLLLIITALAKLANVDVSRPSKAALAIENETVKLKARVAPRTIEDHLRRIPAALRREIED